ncbi:Fe-S biogenesis protein NfuA [Enterobacteriaceae endosymbiont of Donacia tomentosa]|uniref:NifU family protein n=1 Tax=Enterobacteriaceae endosymbiont of Donacia tomentosa TaxID=2675787 RepID=UPI001449A6FF|nr:NifU family protein [Enterobacteriaceae endosymbiont of Donacia tomentosa]QJC31656.1 Fe-S biogenesis protein NfuA [Enterobacteriaceae endosymbiont of Donacia tomentosa]
MLQITNKAQKYFLNLLRMRSNNTQIKISILKKKNVFKGNIAFCDIQKIKKTDFKLEFKKFNIFIDKNNLELLENIKIDVIKDNSSLKEKFIFLQKNSKISQNIKSLKKDVNDFLTKIINPQLLNHNGFVLLKNITPNYIVLIEFNGGCQGCSMSNYTLKNYIEKKLLQHFPILNGVHDVTLHKKIN